MSKIIAIEKLGVFKQTLMTLLDSLFAKKSSVYTNTQVDSMLANYVNDASYNSTTGNIELKHGSTVLATIDASLFILDGMMSDVEVSSGNLVMTFNIDGGSRVVSIPISDVFDATNYYNKTAADAKFQDKVAIVSQSASSVTIDPNVLNKWGEINNLTVAFAAGATGEVNEYMIQFTCAATVLTLPNTVRWANGDPLETEAGYTYQVSIVDNLAVYAGWEAKSNA